MASGTVRAMTRSTAPLPPRRNRLSEQREKSRLTQKEVAKLLDIDFTTVSAHENGRRGLTQPEIKKYAALFKVESYELFLDSKGKPLTEDEEEVPKLVD